MGGRTRAARGSDRGGGRPDAMALREGRRTAAADMAGGNSSRRGRTLQQRATVTYRPDSPCGSAWLPLTFPWALLVGSLSPLARLSAIWGGGGSR